METKEVKFEVENSRETKEQGKGSKEKNTGQKPQRKWCVVLWNVRDQRETERSDEWCLEKARVYQKMGRNGEKNPIFQKWDK